MFLEHRRIRPGKEQLATEFAGAGTEINDAIRRLNGVWIMLDDEDGVSEIAEGLENVDEPLRVARMEADRRLVEHVERTYKMRTERRGELNPLGFSAGERGSQTVESKVVEADFVEELQTCTNFFENLVRDLQVPFGELQSGKKGARFFDGELANLRDRFSGHADGTCLGAKARPPTFRTSRITAKAAEKNAYMQLVFFSLQPVEETFDPFVVILGVAFENQAALFGSELPPRHVRRNSAGTRPFSCVLEKHAVARFRPGLDGAVVERLARVRDDQIQIKIDGISESLAARTRPVWIIEGEKARLWLLVESAVVLAFEAFVEGEPLGGIPRGVRDEFENGFALPFAVTDFDRVNKTRARLRTDGKTVDKDVDGFGEIDIEQSFRRREFMDAARLVEAVETALLQIKQRRAKELGRWGANGLLLAPFRRRRCCGRRDSKLVQDVKAPSRSKG